MLTGQAVKTGTAKNVKTHAVVASTEQHTLRFVSFKVPTAYIDYSCH